MRRGPVQISPADLLPRAVVLYRFGLSQAGIAKRFNCCTTTVARALRLGGIEGGGEARGTRANGVGGSTGHRTAAKAALGD